MLGGGRIWSHEKRVRRARLIITCKYHGMGLGGARLAQTVRIDHLTAQLLRCSFK